MRWWLLSVSFVVVSMSHAQYQANMVLELISDCVNVDWFTCLKIKMLTGLEKFKNAENISIANGISFVDENFIPELSRPMSETILQKNLPRSLEDRNKVLDSLLYDKFLGFLSKYTLRFKLSNLKGSIEEARGKKKYSNILMMPLMMAASFIPIALGALAILAGKALIVGKMALLLTGILGIRKLFSKDGEDEHQRAMKRISDFGMRLKSDMMAHRMTYRGMTPNDLNSDM